MLLQGGSTAPKDLQRTTDHSFPQADRPAGWAIRSVWQGFQVQIHPKVSKMSLGGRERKDGAAGLCFSPAALGQTKSLEEDLALCSASGGFAGTRQVAGAQVVNTAENFTSLIGFEPVTSKERLYHARRNTLKLKRLQSFMSARAVMTAWEGIAVSGFWQISSVFIENATSCDVIGV